MPHVKIDFMSDDDGVDISFRPSVSIEDEGAVEHQWGISRESGQVAQEDLEEWESSFNGLPDGSNELIYAVINALLKDKNHYNIRILYDREPDGEDPAVEPETLQTSALVTAVQDLLNSEGFSYR